MISQTAEYALRAVVCLAQHVERSLTTQEVAERTGVGAGYLSKVLQSLGRAGVVQARRGLHGGFTLAQPIDRLTVLDVINSVDPIKRVRTCPLHLEEHNDKLCALHRRLDQACEQAEGAFAATSIAELLQDAECACPFNAEPADKAG